MAEVVIPAQLSRHTGGRERLRVDAVDVRQLMARLGERFPELLDALGDATAVAIDGEIVNEPMFEALSPDSEVHFLPPISGGR